jgi:hypothetical protein
LHIRHLAGEPPKVDRCGEFPTRTKPSNKISR